MIVVGLSCICVLACALVTLQLRENNRRITGSRQRSGYDSGRSGDRTRDHLDTDAPPSYDTGKVDLSVQLNVRICDLSSDYNFYLSNR